MMNIGSVSVTLMDYNYDSLNDQLLETLANPEGRFKTLEGFTLKVKTGSRITARTLRRRGCRFPGVVEQPSV